MPEDKKHAASQQAIQKRKPLFSQNAGIFIICIALASVFWLLINLSYKFESDVEVPIRYINFPNDQVLTSELPSQFSLSVTAPGWELVSAGFKKNSRQLTIDLSNYELSRFINTNTFLSEISGQLPSEFELINISPMVIQVATEEKMSKKVPVVPVLDLEFESQFDISGPIITEPDSIVVSGAESYISGLKEWKTKRITKKGVNQDLSLAATVETVNNISMSLSTNEIKCYVPVDQFTEKSYSNIMIEMINCEKKEEIMIYPNNVKITFQVSLADFDKISESQFQVAIDCADIDLLTATKADLTITSMPEFVKGVMLSPSTVEFIIYK